MLKIKLFEDQYSYGTRNKTAIDMFEEWTEDCDIKKEQIVSIQFSQSTITVSDWDNKYTYNDHEEIRVVYEIKQKEY